MFTEEIAGNIASVTGINQESIYVKPVSGGSINECYRIKAGKDLFFIKLNNAQKFPGMFEAEEKGLELIRMHSALRIPRVIKTGILNDQAYILMEFIDSGIRKKEFFSLLGEGLAVLHRVKHETAGLDHDNYIGSLQQINTAARNPIDFFISCRITPMSQLAEKNGIMPSDTSDKLEKVMRRLHDFLPDEPPSLLHGDLWSGNYLHDEKGMPVLIDPAVYYGHREADIAMTLLFGGFSQEFYDAYNHHFPLKRGWEKRMEIWNLYPLLVHLNLFGQGYLSGINTVLKKYA